MSGLALRNSGRTNGLKASDGQRTDRVLTPVESTSKTTNAHASDATLCSGFQNLRLGSTKLVNCNHHSKMLQNHHHHHHPDHAHTRTYSACDPFVIITPRFHNPCGKQHLREMVGFCKEFTTLSYTKEYVRFVNLLTKSGLGISRKCCFPHGSQHTHHIIIRITHIRRDVDVCDPFVIITPRFYNIIASSSSGSRRARLLTSLKSASKTHSERFVRPSKSSFGEHTFISKILVVSMSYTILANVRCKSKDSVIGMQYNAKSPIDCVNKCETISTCQMATFVLNKKGPNVKNCILETNITNLNCTNKASNLTYLNHSRHNGSPLMFPGPTLAAMERSFVG